MLILLSAFSFARGTIVGVGETVPADGGTTTTTTTTNDTTTPPPDDTDSGPTPQVTITPADGSDAPSGEGSDWENSEILGVGETSGTQQPASSTGNGQQAGGTASASCFPALVLAGFALLALFAKK
jgi:hypothetical protein